MVEWVLIGFFAYNANGVTTVNIPGFTTFENCYQADKQLKKAYGYRYQPGICIEMEKK